MAYGQTGAGKTYTMHGAAEAYENRGVVPRAISQVFKSIKTRRDRDISIRVSYVEIYNEHMQDLLSTFTGDATNGVMQDLAISDESGHVEIKGLTTAELHSESEVSAFSACRICAQPLRFWQELY